MATTVTRLSLPTRLTRDPQTGVQSPALPGSPAHDVGLLAAHIDNVLAPAIEAAADARTASISYPIEVSG
jgi:hypothetical protein